MGGWGGVSDSAHDSTDSPESCAESAESCAESAESCAESTDSEDCQIQCMGATGQAIWGLCQIQCMGTQLRLSLDSA